MITSKMQIRGKLILLFLLFGMVPVVAITPIVMSKLSEMQQTTLSAQMATAAAINETIDRNLFERYGDVQAFGLNAAAHNPANWRNPTSANPLVSAMDGYMANYGLYKLMLLVGLDGQVLATNMKAADGKALATTTLYDRNFKDASWFQKAIKSDFLKGKDLTGTVVENAHYDPIVADLYKEDGFVLTFAAPVKDPSGKMVGIWANFADFGLVEGIVQAYYEQEKAAGKGYSAFGIEDANGIALVNFDPADIKYGDTYKRDSSAIGKKSLAALEVPASEEALKSGDGTSVEADTKTSETDAVGWAKSKGAYDYPGLGWTVIMHTPGAEAFASIHSAKMEIFIIIGVAAAIILGAGGLFGTLASKPLRKFASVMQAIAKGDYTVKVEGATRTDEMGSLAKAMESLKDTLDTNTRVKQALDRVTSNVMMADENYNIIYLNESVLSFLREAEKDIQKDLPRFSVANLMGSSIDVFHKNPTYQRNMLEKMHEAVKTSIQVGGRSFNLVAVPLFDQNKKRIGTTVEWQDGTAAGMVDAINKAQAVIEFQPDGTIINANANFLSAMGYTLDEIRGKHHSMFADPAYAASSEYKQFWENLNRGTAQAGEFKRFGKGGREIWINATYNPIADLKGKVVRVVKTAADITQMVQTRTENEIGMNEAVKVLTGISEGDLTLKMEYEYKGTFSDIKKAVNATVDRLFDMVKRIKDAAQSVSSASGEISAGSSDLSQRTEQQASSLEETAASMEQITGTVRANSENAKNANQLSGEASDIAGRGGKVAEEAVGAMQNIEKSSQKISDIITVIDEIAFQTNLLALNAAVEAARAGEAGKGFAVVASEVRSLAGRSASASKEIKTLISESVEQVKSGAGLVNQAGDTLKDIVASVKKVAEIIAEISAASQEQATGIDEINSAISQMDEVTQQNAALVEENTAASQSLVHQAQELDHMMRFFRIGESPTEGDAPPPPSGRDKPETHSAPTLVSTKPTAKDKPKPVVKPGAKPAAASKPAPARKIAAASGVHAAKNGTDREWEEF